MSTPLPTVHADVSQFLRVAKERHRSGEAPRLVVRGLADGIDGIIRQLFREIVDDAQDQVALVAIGGYGRRELCPYSDIDLLFLHGASTPDDRIERLVRALWDGGFQLGHSVRQPAECFRYMVDDHITGSALLEGRYLAGSSALWDQFSTRAVQRFRKRRGEQFVEMKLAQLRQSLYGADRTIWVVEPHVKEGPCCLRDIQRVLWIQNVRRGQASVEDLDLGDRFDTRPLVEAYSFYLRLRCELHFQNGLRQDILERDAALEVARQLGYAGSPRESVESLMADYYRHARLVSRTLREFAETDTRGTSFLRKLSQKIFRSWHKPYAMVDRRILFPKGEFPEVSVEEGRAPAEVAEEVTDLFFLAQREDLYLSESLSKRIRAATEGVDFAHSPVVSACFAAFLGGEKNVGRLLKAMHRAGVLTKILPEFEAIDGMVNFDDHHQFTVDEHTLRALEALDAVERADEGVPSEIVQLCRRVGDRFPLRLAILLHDVGKGLSKERHEIAGSEAAILVCDRLGLEEDVCDLVEFLVYRHLAMFRFSESRDFTQEGVIESFARVVGDQRRLDLLYLMTYVDVSSVARGTWTGWKAVQLEQLYQRTSEFLRTGAILRDPEERIEASPLSTSERELVLEHYRLIDSEAYRRETVPERLLVHANLAAQYRAEGVAQICAETFRGFHEIFLCTGDRPRLFADFTGILFSEGLNVLGARVASRNDGVAVDTFYVEVADGVLIPMHDRLRQIQAKFRDLESGARRAADFVAEWEGSYRYRRMVPRGFRIDPPHVKIDNDLDQRATLVEVIAIDRPGLLYRLAAALSTLGLDVRSAKVSTATNRARDVFYVSRGGEKVRDPEGIIAIERALLAEVDQPAGAERGAS